MNKFSATGTVGHSTFSKDEVRLKLLIPTLFVIHYFACIHIPKVEVTVSYSRQITGLILSKYIGLYVLSRPRSNLDTF